MSPSNTRISNGDAQLIEEFIRDLEATSDQVQKLLDTVRSSELDFAAIKTELRILCENVKDISFLLRDGEGGNSVITRIFLLEQRLKELEKDFEKTNQKEKDSETSNQKSFTDIILADKQGKWQMKIAMATGIIGALTSIVTMIANHLK